MTFNPKLMGYAMASYFGGRAEVRVRKTDVPVRVLDFTSMYPTVFILQDLQALIASPRLRQRTVTVETREVLDGITLDRLYDPGLWPKFRRLVRVRPHGEILPVRMRFRRSDPYTIAVTPFTSTTPRWYTLADIIAAKLLGNSVPFIEEAIEVTGDGPSLDLAPMKLRGMLELDPATQIFKTVVEERQRAKLADQNSQLGRLNLALKVFANSGAYGIFAEINVSPSPKPQLGRWFSDLSSDVVDVHDERPGEYFNPVVATLVTGASRLVLAMLEAEVQVRGGTFAFCDTDSLAIVAGTAAPPGVPCLNGDAASTIIAKFDKLNPYDAKLVPHLLKVEYAEHSELRCFAVSAKRYVLFTLDHRRRRLRHIVAASESGLGALFGRSAAETTPKLARRVWSAILATELGLRDGRHQKQRVARLHDFHVPLRRRLPISSPAILTTRGFAEYNRTQSYDFRIKPFGFLQSAAPATVIGTEVTPIAPMEVDLIKSRSLPWTDFRTGKRVRLDWDGNGLAGTLAVMTLAEYIHQYANHPESKAADAAGNPAGPDARGVLGRLHLIAAETVRVGKEINRLDEAEAVSLDDDGPIVYRASDQDEVLRMALDSIQGVTQRHLAAQLGISERRLRDVIKGRAIPRPRLRDAIVQLARSQDGHGK